MTVRRSNILLDAPLADLVARDTGATIGLPLELDGADVSGAGTATVYKPDDTVLQTGAVAIVDDEAQIILTPATLADEDFSLNYRIVWELTIGGVDSEYRTRLGITLFDPICPLTDAALEKYRPTLKARILRGTGRTTLQETIETGWGECQRWLISKGSHAERCVDSSELYELTRAFTLYEAYSEAAMGTDTNGTLAKEATRWERTLRDLKGSLNLTYDTNEDGLADEKRSAHGSIWLSANGSVEGRVY